MSIDPHTPGGPDASCRVLMMLYHAPPRNTIAAQRVRRLIPDLPGHGVTPLAVSPALGEPAGVATESWDGTPVSVHRFTGFDPMASRAAGRAPAAATSESGSPAMPAPAGTPSPRRWNWRRMVRSFAAPDERAGLIRPWVREALAAAEGGVDAVYSSSSPYSAHLAAYRVSRRLGVPWILEMRDLWADNPYLVQTRNPVSRRLAERWERICLHAAHRIVVLTEAHRRHLARKYPALEDRLRVVSNSFTPREGVARSGPSSTLRILHAGNLYGGRTLASLGGVVDELQGALPGYDSVTLEVAGQSFDTPWAEVLGGDGANRVVHGSLEHARVIDLFDEVHAGVVHNPAMDRIHIPGKLYEYVGAGLPVLSLSSQPDIPDICGDAVPCWQISPGDAAGLRRAVKELAAWWREHPGGVNRPDASHPAAAPTVSRRLAEVLREAVGGGA